MAGRKGKLIVFDVGEDTRVPFLRGILTRSLQDAGLTFDEAYAVATDVRVGLEEEGEVTSLTLRRKVCSHLEKIGLGDVASQYRTPRNERVSVYVRGRDGTVVPFSKTVLVQSLEVCAAPNETLYGVAAAVERQMLASGKQEVSTHSLMEATYALLLEAVGENVSRRYLRWQEFTDTDRPLILLVGGVTGTGKSTISSLAAHRLGIVRSQSTDMLREVMRRMIPRRLIPSLHESSFLAHRALPRWGQSDGTPVEPHMVDGYLTQAGEVGVGIEGVFRRAVEEQVSLIIEGVHLHPQMQRALAETTEAVVVPVLLATIKKKGLQRQLVGRGLAVKSRRAERYLENFEDIWQLQTFLLSEADQHDVPIVTEREPDEMVRRIMRVIADHLELEFAGDPAVIFSRPKNQSAEDPA
ncbi:MAG: 2-phosphoglycerate kinase [Rhodothermales bacterium]|jgi:2-phosphoglycerate kinase